jgi:HlyD family secretion protein
LKAVKAVKINRIAWVGLVLLLVTLGGSLFLVSSPASSELDQTQQEMQSAITRSGDLTISASGSGELVAVSETRLSFEESGELLALNVGVGDQVQAGDVLATIKLDRTAADLAADIAKAELDLLLAQQKIDQIVENAQIETAEAQLALEEAQLAVEKLQNYETEQALALQSLHLAEEAVEDAEMNLYITNSAPSEAAMNTAYASLLFKEKELHEIQDQITRVEYQFKSSSNQMVRDRLDQQLTNLRLQLANQQLEYESALYKYETLDEPPKELDLRVAEARLVTAQAQLSEAERNWADVQDGPPTADLTMAAARLVAAQAEWERLNDGPDPDELELLEAQLARAEIKLQALQNERLISELVAHMDGTVLTIEAEVGDRVGNEAIITIGDLSQMLIAVSLDEIDQASVQVGNQVEIVFDALPERTFQGEVIQMSPSLIKVGNSEAFRIWVVLEKQPGDLIDLPLGVNAVVDVITGEARGSVLVSRDALIEDGNGGYSVYVIEGENLERRPVQVGLLDATTAEIAAGLQPGEKVAIGNVNVDWE